MPRRSLLRQSRPLLLLLLLCPRSPASTPRSARLPARVSAMKPQSRANGKRRTGLVAAGRLQALGCASKVDLEHASVEPRRPRQRVAVHVVYRVVRCLAVCKRHERKPSVRVVWSFISYSLRRRQRGELTSRRIRRQRNVDNLAKGLERSNHVRGVCRGRKATDIHGAVALRLHVVAQCQPHLDSFHVMAASL